MVISGTPPCTGLRPTDIVATSGQLFVDANFDVTPRFAGGAWPLGPTFTVPALVYAASPTAASHRGSANVLVPDVPEGVTGFDLEFTVVRPTDAAVWPAGAPSHAAWDVFVTLPDWAAPARGRLEAAEGLLDSNRPVRLPVVWSTPPPAPTTALPGAELMNVSLVGQSGVLPAPVGILGVRMVWWMS